jgi:hypothetical protein
MDPQAKESTVVTDHRMAFSISQEHTVLWDQIRYQGNPTEFVWALPVKPGTVVELSSDRWMSALDAYTQPAILSPPHYSSYGGGGGGGGCFSVGCGASDNASGFADEAADIDGGATVQVVNEAVVGPYETVTLHSSDPNALENWLTSHGYAISDADKPVIAAYVAEGFDFIALRLLPNQGVNAMQPVRIISPGADVTLPLRMVAVGVGQTVGVTLFVIGEGRYHPQNFPDAQIDFGKLTWNDTEGRSNYQELSVGAMAENNGRSFITEFAQQTPVFWYNPAYSYSPPNQLASLYYGNCSGTAPVGDTHAAPSTSDAGTSATCDAGPMTTTDSGMSMSGPDGSDDASTDDASADDGSVVEAGAGPDAGAGMGGGNTGDSDAGTCGAPPPPSGGSFGPNDCASLDDLAVATEGMDPNSVWVTRLRANLPLAALSVDLKLAAVIPQSPVSSQHTATSETTGGASIAPSRENGLGSAVLVALTTLVVGVRLRTRRREGREGREAQRRDR